MISSTSGISVASILTLIVLTCQVVFAQSGGSLKVYADSGATVYLDNAFRGVVISRVDGFVIEGLKPGSYAVKVRRAGAESNEHAVTILGKNLTEIDLRAFSPKQSGPVQQVKLPPPTQKEVKSAPTSNILGSERFTGVWREVRRGAGGAPEFEIVLNDGAFSVRKIGADVESDILRHGNFITGIKSFGVVELSGVVRYYGGSIPVTIRERSRLFAEDINNLTPDFHGSDTLTVQYRDVENAGAGFTGITTGIWLRIRR